MRELRYGDASVIVSDDLSDALLHYSKALARADSADVVDVPVVIDGHDDVIKLLLGPASQIIDVPAPLEAVVADDATILADLHARIRALSPAHPVPSTPEETQGFTEEY